MARDEHDRQTGDLLKRPQGRPVKYGRKMNTAERKAAERARKQAAGLKIRHIWIPRNLEREPGQLDQEGLDYALGKQLEHITALHTTYGEIPVDYELAALIRGAIGPALERRRKALKDEADRDQREE